MKNYRTRINWKRINFSTVIDQGTEPVNSYHVTQQDNCSTVIHSVLETNKSIHILWRFGWSLNVSSLWCVKSDVTLIKILTINDRYFAQL